MRWYHTFCWVLEQNSFYTHCMQAEAYYELMQNILDRFKALPK
jgi:hypothetical protein